MLPFSVLVFFVFSSIARFASAASATLRLGIVLRCVVQASRVERDWEDGRRGSLTRAWRWTCSLCGAAQSDSDATTRSRSIKAMVVAKMQEDVSALSGSKLREARANRKERRCQASAHACPMLRQHIFHISPRYEFSQRGMKGTYALVQSLTTLPSCSNQASRKYRSSLHATLRYRYALSHLRSSIRQDIMYTSPRKGHRPTHLGPWVAQEQQTKPQTLG